MNRIILVGQAPGKGGDPSKPLRDGPTGRRLRELTGLTEYELELRYERMNVLNFWPGCAGSKGDAFPLELARGEAFRLRSGWTGRRAILLGRNVANAFRFDADFFQWGEVTGGFQAAVVPHPSPVNLFWNDPRNVELAELFFAETDHG